MFCVTGFDLYERYQAAEKAKLDLSQKQQYATREGPPTNAKLMTKAKQQYVEHFANWLSHKAFCLDCKPKAPSREALRSSAPGR